MSAAARSRLTIHWVSFLLHCLSVLLLLLAYCLPYWYLREDGENEQENCGLWVRCRVGGGCQPLGQVSAELATHMRTPQVLMTFSFVSSLVSLAFYAVWLWKGEMCDTPWEKRCTWCRESYERARMPKTEATDKFRNMKWAAFGCSFLAGLLALVGVIIFMVSTLSNMEGKLGQLGWCSWIALMAGVLLLVKNGVISLCSYLLRPPSQAQEEDEDFYDIQMVSTEKEEERIRAWISSQQSGLENPSFTREWDYPKHNSMYSTRSGISHKGSDLYYKGQNNPAALDRSTGNIPSTLGSVGNRAGSIPLHYHPKPEKPGTHPAVFSPMYSVIFKGKVPMIPKKNMTPKSRAVYDTIYGLRGGAASPTFSDGSDNYESIAEIRGLPRPASHLGVTSRRDDMTRSGKGHEYDGTGRRMSDSHLTVGHPRRKGTHSRSNTPSPMPSGPFKPGIVPEAYRRRKHRDRRSNQSLYSGSSHDRSSSQDHNTSFGYRVRTKTADESTESINIPLSMVLSHGVHGLDMTGSEDYTLDNIWVVPSSEDIPEVLGRERVHSKLHQSIQDLDKLDQVEELSDSTEA